MFNDLVDAWRRFWKSNASDSSYDNFLYLGVFLFYQLRAKSLDDRFAYFFSTTCLVFFNESIEPCLWHDARILDQLSLHAVDVEVL